MALAACLVGYGEVGLWLKKEAAKPNSWVKWEGNRYLKWMEDYAGKDFQDAVSDGLGTHAPPFFLFFSSCVSRVINNSNTMSLSNDRGSRSIRSTFTCPVRGVVGRLGEVYPSGKRLLGYGDERAPKYMYHHSTGVGKTLNVKSIAHVFLPIENK